jgi:hypothetical protein
MKFILGIFVLALPFLILFAIMFMNVGLKAGLFVIGAVSFVVLCSIVGTILID